MDSQRNTEWLKVGNSESLWKQSEDKFVVVKYHLKSRLFLEKLVWALLWMSKVDYMLDCECVLNIIWIEWFFSISTGESKILGKWLVPKVTMNVKVFAT